jgi:D-arabinose 1-dehydrogenase-like Zn-dependent alcohol dehydrogenase
MSTMAYIAKAAKQKLVLQGIDFGPLGSEDVEVAVEHCGLCHSDLSILNNNWSGSPVGSPAAIETMLDFASRHNVLPQTEHFPMSKINEAFARLESGKARYRIVLDADF